MRNLTASFIGLLCLCATSAHSETFNEASAAAKRISVNFRAARTAAVASQRSGAGAPAYAAECGVVGFQKLETQAKAYGIKVDMRTFRLSETDDRPGNPSKFLWWSVDVVDVNGRTDVFPPGRKPELTTMTQKYRDEPCF